MDNYRKAVRYAGSFVNDELRRDAVHNAYISYYNKYSEDLFKAPISKILHFVKRSAQNLRRNKYMYKGVLYDRKFVYLQKSWKDEKNGEDLTQENMLESKFSFHTGNTIFEQIVEKDQYNTLSKILSEKQMDVLDRRLNGYSIMEIAKLYEVDHSSIRLVTKQIQQKYAQS